MVLSVGCKGHVDEGDVGNDETRDNSCGCSENGDGGVGTVMERVDKWLRPRG